MNKSRSQYLQQATGMNQTQVKYCKKITQKIFDYPISETFRLPFDYLDQNDKIKKPMDLGIIIEKLEEGQYQSVEKWKEDMNLVFKNATYLQDPFSYISAELVGIFKRLTEDIPKNELEEWRYKVKKAHAKLVEAAESKPYIVKKSTLQPGNRPAPRPSGRIILRASSSANI